MAAPGGSGSATLGMRHAFCLPVPILRLTKEQLLPPTPSVYLENKKDACSPQLQEFCLQHPITVVRGIAAALKLDLGLFSTKQLVEVHPEHPVHVRTQIKQSSDENWDGPGQQAQVWALTSRQSVTTMAAYAKYQVATFQEAFQQEQEKTASQRAEEEAANRKRKKPMPTLKHGFCVDLSFEHKFRCQLQELMKLPAWTKVVSAGNMLSHIGKYIFKGLMPFGSVSDPYSFNPDPAKQIFIRIQKRPLNPEPDPSCFYTLPGIEITLFCH